MFAGRTQQFPMREAIHVRLPQLICRLVPRVGRRLEQTARAAGEASRSARRGPCSRKTRARARQAAPRRGHNLGVAAARDPDRTREPTRRPPRHCRCKAPPTSSRLAAPRIRSVVAVIAQYRE